MSKTPEKMEEQIEHTLSRISPENQATARRYVKIRRLQGLRPPSLYNYALVLLHLDTVTAGKPYKQTDSDQILDFLIDLSSRTREATKVTYVRLLKCFFEHIHEGNTPHSLSSVLTVRDPVVPDDANLVNQEHLVMLLGACKPERRSRRFDKVAMSQALVLSLYDSGMRISELLSLKFKDVELQGNGVELKLDPRHPNLKSGARTIYVEECTAALKTWMALHPWPGPSSYIFLSEQSQDASQVMPDKTVDALLKRLAKRAELFQGTAKPLSPHDFRHSSATRRSHWGESKLRLFHGWSKNSKMPSRYVHHDLEALRESVRRDTGANDLGIATRIDTATKACPMCAEDIRIAARKCKHCGSDVAASVIAA